MRSARPLYTPGIGQVQAVLDKQVSDPTMVVVLVLPDTVLPMAAIATRTTAHKVRRCFHGGALFSSGRTRIGPHFVLLGLAYQTCGTFFVLLVLAYLTCGHAHATHRWLQVQVGLEVQHAGGLPKNVGFHSRRSSWAGFQVTVLLRTAGSVALEEGLGKAAVVVGTAVHRAACTDTVVVEEEVCEHTNRLFLFLVCHLCRIAFMNRFPLAPPCLSTCL
jgi:hypothetical protein